MAPGLLPSPAPSIEKSPAPMVPLAVGSIYGIASLNPPPAVKGKLLKSAGEMLGRVLSNWPSPLPRVAVERDDNGNQFRPSAVKYTEDSETVEYVPDRPEVPTQ